MIITKKYLDNTKFKVGQKVYWSYGESLEDSKAYKYVSTIIEIGYDIKDCQVVYKVEGDFNFNFDDEHLWDYETNKDAKEMTVEEISKELGYEVKIVK